MMDSILFRAEDGDISGFLNLAAENGLTIQKFCKAEGVCFGYLPPAEYRIAARLARASGVRLKIMEKNGVSFALKQYRRRMGLIVWPVVFSTALVFSQNFLWAVDVTGCETLSDTVIRQSAEEAGLREGIFLPRADLAGMSAKLRQEFPQIASLSMNRVGSRVEIALTEAALAPAILPDEPCNLIASATGKITAVSVTKGQAVVSPGQTIAEGQLLISGIIETPDGKSVYDHASGTVTAETVIEKTFTLQLEQTEQIFTGEEKTCRSLDLFGKKLPLFLPDSLQGEEKLYDSTSRLEPLDLFGYKLPVGTVTETRRYYTEGKKVFTEEEALTELQKAAALCETEELAGTDILAKEESASLTGGTMTLRVSYTCLADIACPQPIGIAE